MLTKKEIKGMSNVDLIHRLCSMMYSTRVYKSDITAAKNICAELESRGAIESAEALSNKWEKTYTM